MRLLKVAELNNYIKEKLESDLILSNLWVKGEISNFKHHYSGHMYFTLKDASASVKCVMFRSRASVVKFKPDNGMGVIARGSVGVYERDGQYQLYVEEMQPDGIGALYIAFQQLKTQLEQEGLFRPERKRQLPRMPKKVAVITSPTGAAVKDIVTVLHRRCPQVEIFLMPVAVQGESAPQEIAQAIEIVNSLAEIDVIIVGRGGGSLEELWAFNTEVVARSIYASQIPVVSAVGHETDFTIADFVADLRAPTPSAAAEIVAPDFRHLEQRSKELYERLRMGIQGYVERLKNRVELYSRSQVLLRPEVRLNNLSQQLDFLVSRLDSSVRTIYTGKEARFKTALAEINKLSPLATLERGYAVCMEKGTTKVLSKTDQFDVGKRVEIYVSDGTVDCTVFEIRGGKDDRRDNE